MRHYMKGIEFRKKKQQRAERYHRRIGENWLRIRFSLSSRIYPFLFLPFFLLQYHFFFSLLIILSFSYIHACLLVPELSRVTGRNTPLTLEYYSSSTISAIALAQQQKNFPQSIIELNINIYYFYT